jgi:tetratricopeptide (TPR) repeat protein
VLVTALAGAALLGAGVALGPLRGDERPARTAAAAPAAPRSELDAYVARTTAHLARVPGDWQGWAGLGRAHVELARITYDPGHQTSAESALRRSLAVRPSDNAAALTGLGALAAARHDFTGALGFARLAVAADDFSADAYGVLTDALVELGRYEEATDAVQRMLDLRPDTGSYARASYVFELHGNLSRAGELMQRALDVAGTPADAAFALRHLGELAFNAGDLDTAAARCTEGLARLPGDPALLADRARVRAARGDLPGAVTDLRTATAVVPGVDHLMALSDTLTAAGDPAGANRTDDLIRVSTELTGSTTAATDIDVVLFHADRAFAGTGAQARRDAAAAVDQGRKVLAARPAVTVETAYAWALHAAGRDREALVHADAGLRLGTRDARSHFYRGTIRRALGDEAGARQDLAEALRINPHFSLRYGPVARAALNELDSAR